MIPCGCNSFALDAFIHSFIRPFKRPKPAANFQQLLLPEARLPERPLRQIRYADVRLVDPRDGQPCDVQWRTLYENVSAADGTAATATSTTDLATMDDTASNITSKPISVRVSSRSGLTIPLQRHRDRKPPHASVSASAGVQRGLGPLDTRRADAEKVTYDIGAEGMDAFECPFPVDLRL